MINHHFVKIGYGFGEDVLVGGLVKIASRAQISPIEIC